ncbi:hypothetical protein GCM10025857_22550 [Alicyclobacillus contaminans]|nr:hypothetical protein GCM10025857_22550 [Alicyclobacillus contaminans]
MQIRIAVSIPAQVTDPQHVCHRGVIRDISTGGAQIVTEFAPFQDATPLTVTFRLGMQYHLPANVVWQQPVSGHRCHLGVRWTHLPAEVQERLTWELLRIAVNRRRLKK